MPRTRSNRNPSRRISRGMRVAAAALILFGVVGCDEDPPEGEHPNPPADETPNPPADETPDPPADETPDPPADETPDPPADETQIPADTYVPPDTEETGQRLHIQLRVERFRLRVAARQHAMCRRADL